MELIVLAKFRLTRSLTTEECQQYLHLEACLEEQARPSRKLRASGKVNPEILVACAQRRIGRV
jgi:hypothetical protein